jgi:hypothetical protein
MIRLVGFWLFKVMLRKFIGALPMRMWRDDVSYAKPSPDVTQATLRQRNGFAEGTGR